MLIKRTGGVDMATSSILENIRVNNPKVIEEFVAAMDASENHLPKKTDRVRTRVTTDPEKIKNLMLKGVQNRGKK